MDNEKKLFLKALQEKFDEDPKDEKTKYYCYGGWEQSARKREFNEEAKKTENRNKKKQNKFVNFIKKHRGLSIFIGLILLFAISLGGTIAY